MAVRKITALDKIKVLKSSISLITIELKLWKRRSTDEHLQKLIQEQEIILAEANAKITEYRNNHAMASAKILKLERSMRFKKKELAIIENAKAIQKLKELQDELKNLKETQDEDDKNQQI